MLPDSVSPDQVSPSLEQFIRQEGISRFLTIRDGQPYCLAPDDPEAVALFHEALAALEAGTITALPAASRTDDR
jgi:hypothetical protein